MSKDIEVGFIDTGLRKNFVSLESGRFEDKRLYRFICRAMNDLKQSPLCGINIPRKLWPKEYLGKYPLKNLWKYDLPNGWRLIYTIRADDIAIVSVILEWFDHKGYERRFRY